MLTFCQLTGAKLQHYVINSITLTTFCLPLFYYWFILLEIAGSILHFVSIFKRKPYNLIFSLISLIIL